MVVIFFSHLNTLNISLLSLLAYMVSEKGSGAVLIFASLWELFSPLASSKIFSLSFLQLEYNMPTFGFSVCFCFLKKYLSHLVSEFNLWKYPVVIASRISPVPFSLSLSVLLLVPLCLCYTSCHCPQFSAMLL